MQVRAVVEDRIEDHTDAALVAGVDELPQQRYVAEVWIDGVVIDRVILVVARTAKNRRQIERGHAEFVEIIQLVEDTLQVAAHKIAECRRGTPWLHIWRVVLGITVAESLRENLVEHRVANPDGRLEHLVRTRIKLKPRVRLGRIQHQAVRREPAREAARVKLERILNRLPCRERRAEKLLAVDVAEVFEWSFVLTRTHPPNEPGVLSFVAGTLELEDDPTVVESVDESAQARLVPHAVHAGL